MNGWSRLDQSSKLSFLFPPQKSSFPPAAGAVATQYVLAGTSTPDASVVVDSYPYITADITTAWANSEDSLPLFTNVRPRTYLGENVPNTKKLAIDLFAESVLFTIKRISEDIVELGSMPLRQKLQIEVLDAKLSSRSNLLGQLKLGY
jgi:hypothetical protein